MKTNLIAKPMLAATMTDVSALQFPVLCTPKIDFFRCVKPAEEPLSRSFKPIRNAHAREMLRVLPAGVDGELGMPMGTEFSVGASALAREDGTPDFRYYVFDYVRTSATTPYEQRMNDLAALKLPAWCIKLMPVRCANVAELEAFEAKCIADGYEGAMIRDPQGPYKFGRSTEREGYLLKMKRFEDSEAVVLDTYEGMSNLNEATKDALGHTHRSSAKDGKVGSGELGGFVVRMANGCEFRLGYNHLKGGVDRVTMWEQRATLVGKTVKFKHQPSGAKDAPRFPQFLSFRDSWDMDS